MISYEVTLQVQPAAAGAVEEFMRGTHIPAIFATGCFPEIRFSRASPGRFRTSYRADTQADLDRYLTEHAPGLRTEFLDRFPDGVSITRETWTLVQSWRERQGS